MYESERAILGLGQTFTEEQLRKAYLRKALRHHPDRDRSAGSTARFQKIGDAYNTLMPLALDRSEGKSSLEFLRLFEEMFPAFERSWLDGIPEEWLQDSHKTFVELMAKPEVQLGARVWRALQGTNTFTALADKLRGMCHPFASTASRSEERNGADKGDVPEPEPYSASKSESDSEPSDGGDAHTTAPQEPVAPTKRGTDVVQVLEVSLEEVYRRDIKKVQFTRYCRAPSNGVGETEVVTVLVPLEHQSVFYGGLGDQRAEDDEAGDAVFVVVAKKHDIYERDQFRLRATLEISPYELCFGGRRVLPHPSGGTVVLEIRENFFERIDRAIVVPGYGLFDAEKGGHDALVLNFRVCTALDEVQMRALRTAFCSSPCTIDPLRDIDVEVYV